MLEKVNLDKVLFLDIETAPQTYKFDDLDESKKHLFESKTRFLQNDEKSFETLFGERASIYAEFGKIICISVGFVHTNSIGEKQIRLKSFYHDDEVDTVLNYEIENNKKFIEQCDEATNLLTRNKKL